MGSPDHAGLGIGKQNGLAIRAEHRQGNARSGCHQRIGARFLRQGAVHGHCNGRMDLMHAQQAVRLDPHRLRHTRAVDRHDFGLVGGAVAAVQSGKYTRRCTALAGKEAVFHG